MTLSQLFKLFTTVSVDVYTHSAIYVVFCGHTGLLIIHQIHRDSPVILNHGIVLNVPVTVNGVDHQFGIIEKLNAEHCGVSSIHVLLHQSPLVAFPPSHCSQLSIVPSPHTLQVLFNGAEVHRLTRLVVIGVYVIHPVYSATEVHVVVTGHDHVHPVPHVYNAYSIAHVDEHQSLSTTPPSSQSSFPQYPTHVHINQSQ